MFNLYGSHIILLIVSILFNATGNVLFKYGALRLQNATICTISGFFTNVVLNVNLIFGFFAYCSAALLYILAIRKIPLIIAAPSTILSYIIIIVLSHFLFKEQLSYTQIFGMFMIFSGVLFLWK